MQPSDGLMLLLIRWTNSTIIPPVWCYHHRRTGRGGGQGGGSCPPPNSGSLSTWIRAESRHYSGKTQKMKKNTNLGSVTAVNGKILPPDRIWIPENLCYYPPPPLNMDPGKFMLLPPPPLRWADQIVNDTQLSLSDAVTATQDRPTWRSIVRDATCPATQAN